MSEKRARKGPVPGHTLSEIVAVAVAMADRDGLAAVTVRALSGELGTGGGALYRYFSSRDQLLDLMVDAAIADLTTPPSSGDPVADLVAVGRELLELYRRHGWLVDVRQAVATPGPHVMDHFERCLAVLAPLPVDASSKMEAIALVTGVVTLFAQHANTGAATRLSVDSPQRWPLLSAALSGAPAGESRPDLFGRVLTGAIRGILSSHR